MNIIIFGPMGSGKDVLADYLVERGYTKRKLGKEIHNAIEMLNYDNIDERLLMQEYAQVCRELFGDKVWICTVLNSVQPNEHTVIADGRQLNELETFTEMNYLTIGLRSDEDLRDRRIIKRDGYSQKDRFKFQTELDALNSVEKCDIIIDNNYSSIMEFTDKFEELLRVNKIKLF